MNKFFIIIIISFFFIRCTPKDEKIPPEILPMDSMKVVVWNLIEAGEYATFLKEKDTTLKSVNTKYFSEVLKLHRIDKINFFKSYNFYQSHPYFNNILFDSVNAYSLRQRNQIYKSRQ